MAVRECFITTFRFHTGSIKSNLSVVYRPGFWLLQFRFHTGSIKRKYTAEVVHERLFRFHTGSIKRTAEIGEQFRFHTVRLKGYVLITLDGDWFRFHTGSIKSVNGKHSIDIKQVDLSFRFHTGSIKSNTCLVYVPICVWRFDSILVRLKGLAKAMVILYPILVGRVKLIIISLVFKAYLLSTGDCANSLGVRRILVGRGVNAPFP